jgi:hypothetical protein
MSKKILIIYLTSFLAYLLSQNVFAKVDPPNYDFSFDKLKPYFPEKPLPEGKHELIKDNGDYKIYKTDIAHIRYKFALFVQIKDKKITDFFARLPGYFLHDVFHQSLIKRYGDQNVYQKHEGSALYIWNKRNDFEHIYSGTCTITCFPVFYSVTSKLRLKDEAFRPLMKMFAENKLQ